MVIAARQPLRDAYLEAAGEEWEPDDDDDGAPADDDDDAAGGG